MQRSNFHVLSLVIACTIVCSTASAQLTPYSQDFEGLNMADPNALGDDGWVVGANVFDPGGGFLGNYFSFPAPNGGPAFSAISDASGAPVGNQGLVVYNDYNNAEHANGNLIEAIVYREQTIAASDVGKVAEFTFVAADGDLEAPTVSEAFIKTLDPNAGFALTNYLTQDTTVLPAGNSTYTLSLPIDDGLVGQLFQIGFASTATNYIPSGVNYDNINLAIVPEPSTLALLAFAGVAVVGARCRRHSSNS